MAGLAANIIYGLAILVATLSVAGFIHAFVTPRDQVAFGSILRPRAAPTSA